MRIGETEIGEQCEATFILFPLAEPWPYDFKASFTISFQEKTCGIDVWINFASMSVANAGMGQSGKCYGIRESFLVRKEMFFTALFYFGETKITLFLCGGENKCSSYLKIVLINILLCGLLEKVTVWNVSAVMYSAGYGILHLNYLKICLISLSCYLGPN